MIQLLRLFFQIEEWMLFLIGIFQSLHLWINNLNGGKGFASFLGILFALELSLMLIVCIVWLLVFIKTKISSASTLISANLSSFYSLIFLDFITSLTLLFLNLIIIFSHQENVKRLRKGKESKIL